MSDLFDYQTEDTGPVECLGQTFPNDHSRRDYFLAELAKKLKDPEFRKIEGFPLGTDEDILNLSDPPYYTACPNPWLAEFIQQWEAQKPEQPADFHYHREPFAADVSEGKNDPIYNAHSYHTKVPFRAVMRYILHFTDPGDIVFDGFCGTGMTGIACQMCGNREILISLGYQVRQDGVILQQEADEEGKLVWLPFSKLGVRRAVLNDLSPAATFLANNFNMPVDLISFENESGEILEQLEEKYGWMYETKHSDGRIGRIIYAVWSDVYECQNCQGEVVYWKSAIDIEKGIVRDKFSCPHCGSDLTKDSSERVWEKKYDQLLQKPIRQAKQMPVLFIYSVPGLKGRFEKEPDEFDLQLISKIEKMDVNEWHPNAELPDGFNTRQPMRSHGMTHVHHFYTKRNLVALAAYFSMSSNPRLKFLFTAFVGGATKLNQFHLKNYVFGGGGINPGSRKGTLYAPSISMEVPIISLCSDRVSTQIRAYKQFVSQKIENTMIGTASCGEFGLSVESDILDYIFIDPPFGSNLNYSELSFAWESWLKVKTNNAPEAIENSVQNKGATEYRLLMTKCFREAYRLLKPGRWMTVEFSNTKASVWNNIQASLSEAGFIVANVSSLDKKQGGINANISKTAVKQDLVISAYKPNGGFEERFAQESRTEEGIWDFVRTHLKYLPIVKRQGSILQNISERDPRILFDQLIAYYVRRGLPVPISSHEFQTGLAQHFIERDDMIFLADQVAEYDRKRIINGQTPQMTLFVCDENSAIAWLRLRLKDKPQAYNDIQPDFMPLLSHLNKNERELINLNLLLEQNFLCYDGKEPVPEQIHAYLSSNWKELRNLPKDDATLKDKAYKRWYVPDPNKAGDLEKLREKALLKEFEHYKEAKKKLKIFRLEAVRAGFKDAWSKKDYQTIITMAQKIPDDVLQEDEKLLLWYDQALTRMESQ